METKFNKNSEKAITMIALVISILIIIILTGIALNIAFDDSGILSRSANTASDYEYDSTYEELNSIILAAETDDIRNEPTLKSVVNSLLNQPEYNFLISSKSRIDDPNNIGNITSISDLTGSETEVYIIYKNFEFKLDDDLKLHKIDIYYAIADNNNIPSDNETNQSSVSDYISDGLILHYDGIQNTRSGNNPNATVWEDLTDNHNDGVLTGFNSSTGYYSSEENGYVLLGHDSFIESTNNLGLTGDAEYTIEIVCKPWSDEKAGRSGPSDFIDLWDYGTIYNELPDQGKNTYAKLNRISGNIKNCFVNMVIDYNGIFPSNDNTVSLVFKKASGTIGTSGISSFKVLKDNTELSGSYIYDSTWRVISVYS